MARYAYHQTDGNQAEIIAALEANGFMVKSIGKPVDLIAGKRGRTFLIEVKRPKGKLRASQLKFISEWTGHVAVLRSVEDVQVFCASFT